MFVQLFFVLYNDHLPHKTRTGFGKTEVALRAIYRAVLAGRQVAFLAPTTVLAAQHFRTVTRRMPGVNVVHLRGGTTTLIKGKELREEIKNGSAQVVVGTQFEPIF